MQVATVEIPKFNLPSDTSKEVTLSEMTVKNAIAISRASEALSEECTTAFLNAIRQDDASDSSEWTAQDRVFALMWYYIHTVKESDSPTISFKYQCNHCGEAHSELFNLNNALDTTEYLDSDVAREFDFNGKKITVKSLTGADMQALEEQRLAINLSDKNESRVHAAEARAQKVIRSIASVESVESVEDWVKSLPIKTYEQLKQAIDSSVASLNHGPMVEISEIGEVSILINDLRCKNSKEEVTNVSLPFFDFSWIPAI